MPKLFPLKIKPFSTLSATALALFAPTVTAVGQSYGVAVGSGDFLGTRTLETLGLVSSVPRPLDWNDPGGMPQIDWSVTDNGNSFTYRYTFSRIVGPTISHLTIDVASTSGATFLTNPSLITEFAMGDPDIAIDGVNNTVWNALDKDFAVDVLGNPLIGDGDGGPSVPGDGSELWEFSEVGTIDGMTGAMKMQQADWIDIVDNNLHNFYLEFTSEYAPVWGHLYAKSGSSAIGTLSWNGVLETSGENGTTPGWDEGLGKEGYVPVPGGILVPEPSSIMLCGIGLLGLLHRRR